MNENIKLEDTKNTVQLETSVNNQINSKIVFNSQLNQSNHLNTLRNSNINNSNNYNMNNINLFQSPKNIYKNINIEEKNITEKIQYQESNKKIVSKITLFNHIYYLD